jgi:hypothetical protein
VVASWAAYKAGRSAKAASDSADAAAELVRIEQERREDERLLSGSTKGFVARLDPNVTLGGVHVARLFNLGPGFVSVTGVEATKENGTPLERGFTTVVFSDTRPIELHRGEYTRIDIPMQGWTSTLFHVSYDDASGSHQKRVRVQVAGESDIPVV